MSTYEFLTYFKYDLFVQWWVNSNPSGTERCVFIWLH